MNMWEQKCCANCKHRKATNEHLFVKCDTNNGEKLLWICCDDWQADEHEQIEKLREWAVKKAAMYDRKTIERPHQYSAMENKARYELIIYLCDRAFEVENG